MVINRENLSPEAYQGIIEENILRGADQYEGNLKHEIERTDHRIRRGELLMVFSQIKGNVTLVSKIDYDKGVTEYKYDDEKN